MNALRLSRSAELPPARAAAGLIELWAWTLPVALLGSWSCFAAVPGLNWALWTVACATGFLVINRRAERDDGDRYPRAALILACLLSIAAAVTANRRMDAVIFLGVAGLFAFAVLSRTRRADEIGAAALVRAPLDLGRMLAAEAAGRLAETFAALRMGDAIPLVRGGVMALGLASMLFFLLSAADPTMAGWREVAWQALLTWTFLARDVFFVLLAVLLLGAYGLAARRDLPNAARPGDTVQTPAISGIRFSALERLIVLGAAMTLFLVFFGAELSSRITGPGAHLAAGETFAASTHRGFGEMIVAAALCALVIVTLDRHALRNGREASVRLLARGVIAASLVAVASAYLRVRYYEMAYGYTEQRLYVQVCCGAVAVSLLLLAWELRSAIALPRLIRRVALAGIACIAGLAYWNSAAWIVNANVARLRSTGKLDVSYLERLARASPDAIPALVEALPRLTPAAARQLRESLERTSRAGSIVPPRVGGRPRSWYEWSLRRAAARSALRSLTGTPAAAPSGDPHAAAGAASTWSRGARATIRTAAASS